MDTNINEKYINIMKISQRLYMQFKGEEDYNCAQAADRVLYELEHLIEDDYINGLLICFVLLKAAENEENDQYKKSMEEDLKQEIKDIIKEFSLDTSAMREFQRSFELANIKLR